MRLEVRSLRCERGGRAVLDGVGFALDAGQAALLSGPNGAGKSTLLRAVAGLLRPAAGEIVLDGGAGDETLAERCHYLGHLNGVKRALTVADNARFWSAYLDGRGTAAAALASVGLTGLADVPASLLSSGQARRLGLARLLVAARPVWLLDEPSVSLDAEASAMLADMMREHVRAGGLLIAASHVPLGIAFATEIALGGASAEA